MNMEMKMAPLASLPFAAVDVAMPKSLPLLPPLATNSFASAALCPTISSASRLNGCKRVSRKASDRGMSAFFVLNGKKVDFRCCDGKPWRRRRGVEATGVSGTEGGGEDDRDAESVIQVLVGTYPLNTNSRRLLCGGQQITSGRMIGSVLNSKKKDGYLMMKEKALISKITLTLLMRIFNYCYFKYCFYCTTANPYLNVPLSISLLCAA